MKMGISKISILTTLLSLQEHYKKTYTCVMRKTLQDRLKRYHHISISLSAIDKHLGKLDKLGFINVYQRHGQKEDGTFYNLASNRMLTKRTFWFLLRLGIKVSAFLFKRIVKVSPIFPKQDLSQAQLNKILDSPDASQDEKATAYSALLETMKLKPA